MRRLSMKDYPHLGIPACKLEGLLAELGLFNETAQLLVTGLEVAQRNVAFELHLLPVSVVRVHHRYTW